MSPVKLTPARDGIIIDGSTIIFHRTVRIADDGKQHKLPPSIGRFSVRRVEDYAGRVPAEWLTHGGVFLPMHEREALWMQFSASGPHALKVGLGMVNAVTGKPWSDALQGDEQDYMVLPRQPWLDGIKSEAGTIRQFVAMPLGGGHTVEGQLSGEERYGGLQILSCPAKRGAIPGGQPWSSDVEVQSLGFVDGVICHAQAFDDSDVSFDDSGVSFGLEAADSCAPVSSTFHVGGRHSKRTRRSAPMAGSAPESASRMAKPDMGLGVGGQMRQEIYEDLYGVDVWDQAKAERVFIHLCNATQWQAITGETPHWTVSTHETYNGDWYDVQDTGIPAVPGSEILDGVSTVDEIDAAKNEEQVLKANAAKERRRKARERVNLWHGSKGTPSIDPPPTIIVPES